MSFEFLVFVTARHNTHKKSSGNNKINSKNSEETAKNKQQNNTQTKCKQLKKNYSKMRTEWHVLNGWGVQY